MNPGCGERDPLSKGNTTCLKGILSLIVVLHHLDQNTALFCWVPDGILYISGYLAVAVFFFLTGYGLVSSYHAKGQAYIRMFPMCRILPFWLANALLVLIYSGADVALGRGELSARLVLTSLFFGSDTIVSKGWYLQAALVIYVCFYLIFSLAKTRNARFLLAFAAVGMYGVVCVALSFPGYYYETIPAVLIGGIWWEFREKVEHFGKSKPGVLLLAAANLAVFLLARRDFALAPLFRMVLVVLFLPLCMYVLRVLPIDCAVTRLLGKYSFEIYGFHGLFLLLRDAFGVQNDGVFAVLVIVSTLCAAIALQPVFQRIYGRARRYAQTGK